MLFENLIRMRGNLFNLFRNLYRSVAHPIRNLRRGFYDIGKGGLNYLSSYYGRNLESAIDEHYNRKVLDSFSDGIKSRFDISIKSPGHIYLSRKSLETQVV